jgi:hypothetical protein
MESNKLQTAIGGETIEVTHLDGTKENVFVQLLTMRTIIGPFSELKLGDEPGQAEIYCGKKQGWADSLTCDSLGKILEVGEKLNDPTIAAWMERQAARNTKAKARMKVLGIGVTSAPSSSNAPSA